MDHRHPAKRDDEVLPEPVAARLIDRAIELDGALRTGAPVAELRAAAAEAGISSAAFEAAELIRPLLQLPTNTIVHSPARAPRVLRVGGTAEQLASVKALLDKHESADSEACVARPATAVTR